MRTKNYPYKNKSTNTHITPNKFLLTPRTQWITIYFVESIFYSLKIITLLCFAFMSNGDSSPIRDDRISLLIQFEDRCSSHPKRFCVYTLSKWLIIFVNDLIFSKPSHHIFIYFFFVRFSLVWRFCQFVWIIN